MTDDLSLPRQMRIELKKLAYEAGYLGRSIAEHIAAAIVLDRCSCFNLGPVKVSLCFSNICYRIREGVLADSTSSAMEGAEWVTISASTSLRRVFDEFGDRLIGFDAKLETFTVELFWFDVVNSMVETVRVLVRKKPEAKSA